MINGRRERVASQVGIRKGRLRRSRKLYKRSDRARPGQAVGVLEAFLDEEGIDYICAGLHALSSSSSFLTSFSLSFCMYV